MKKYILLLVLIINLVPYIKDGEMKWTTTEAGAQYYTIEFIVSSNSYVCGIYGNPFVEVSSNILCEMLNPINDPPNDSVENIVKVYGQTVCPIAANSIYEGYDWCVFMVAATLNCSTPCEEATSFYKTYRKELNISGCESTLGANGGDAIRFMKGYNYSTGPMASDDTSLIEGISSEFKAILYTSEDHMFLVYAISVQNGKIIKAREFNSANPVWDMEINTIDYSTVNSIIQ